MWIQAEINKMELQTEQETALNTVPTKTVPWTKPTESNISELYINQGLGIWVADGILCQLILTQ